MRRSCPRSIQLQVLEGLGYSVRESERIVKTFAPTNGAAARRLPHYSDMQKMQARVRSDQATLERLFEEDMESRPANRLRTTRKEKPKAQARQMLTLRNKPNGKIASLCWG